MNSATSSPLRRAASVMLLSVAVAIVWMYFADIHVPNLETRMDLHTQIIHGSATSPLQNRVLVPFLAEGLARLMSNIAGYAAGLMAAYAVIDLVAFALFFRLMFQFLERWYPLERALIGTLFAAALVPLSLRNHYYHPWSSVENMLVVIALILMVRRSHKWLALVVLIAAFNRETSVFIPLTYALTAIPFRSLFDRSHFPWWPIGWTVLYLGIWAAVYGGLSLLLRSAPQTHLIAYGWEFNQQPGNAAAAVINLTLFLGVFWLYAVRGFRAAPVFIQRAAGMIPMYLIASALLNLWYETRPLIPTYPLLIALGLAYLYPDARQFWPAEDRPVGALRSEAGDSPG